MRREPTSPTRPIVTIAPLDPDGAFATLLRHGVAFIVIGGLAADAHGIGWATFDIDIVVATTDANYRALEAAQAEMSAEFVMFSNQRIVPDLGRISTFTGPMLLRTCHGRLDVLKDAGGDTYTTLVVDAVTANVKGVRVASLAAIARMKRAANRPKDREVLPAIEAALRAREQSDGEDSA